MELTVPIKPYGVKLSESKTGSLPGGDGQSETTLTFPAEAWWRIDTDVHAAGDGYVSQSGVLNDPNGRPVALSRQLFAVFG